MWYIILPLLVTIYILINQVIPIVFTGALGAFIGVYVIRPLLWVSLAILVFLSAKREGLNIWKFKKIRKWEIGRSPFEAALLVGGFQISLLIIAGTILGFGESPYSFTPTAIIINIVFVGSMLFGIELSRAYLIKKSTSKRGSVTLALGLITLLFMLIHISPKDFLILNFGDPVASVKFLGETMIPLLVMSLFASYLAYIGGAIASIGYIGLLEAFEWFCPILPDLPWTLMALIGTVAPTMGFLIIQSNIQYLQEKPRKTRRRTGMRDPALSWTAVGIISVLIVFFSFGFLGVQPTIIYSGSMRPTLDVGDIVIVKEVPIEDIEEGDIVRFRTENVTIIHRIHSVFEVDDTKFFMTKGDANDNPDPDPVIPQQIMGKVIFTIPKLGWIPITIKEMIKSLK
jgi:signal peptidase